MKQVILIIFTLLCSSVLLHAQTVQSLVVQAKGGTESTYALNGVQRITFSGSNLLVTKKDKSQGTFTTAAVQKLLFAQRSDAYTITYNLNGGVNDAANTATYTYGVGLTLSNPTQTGYTFGGWYDNASFTGTAITAISAAATGVVTLYAKWTVNTYNITYELNGGTNDAANVTTYTYGVGLTLNAPTKTGYTFGGWYDNTSFTGTEVTTLSTTIHGDITLYAKWTLNTVTWDGATWSPSAPIASDNVIINGDYSDAGFSCNNLTVNAGKQLTIASGTLAVGGNLTLKSDATNGTATLIDNGTVTVGGTTNVEQYLTSGRNWYVSSPLSASTGNVVLGTSGNSLWQYNEVNSDWTTDATSTSTPLSVMKGFVAKTAADGVITFTGGTLNTGNQSITVNRTDNANPSRGFNLVGNPYPSSVDWSAASKTNLLTTMWYRTKEGSDYKFYTYNSTGEGIGVPASVTSQIPSMQAFWVRVDNIGTGTLAFTNAMRSQQSGNPLRAPAAEKTTTQKILRLQVSNGTNSDEAVVYFNQNAADEFDAYDSEKMSNNNAAIPELYTLAGTEKAVINGLNKVTPNNELALGFTTGETNTFTIKATEISNFDTDIRIILKDKLLNTEQELTAATDYSFSSDPVSTASRFSIVFRSASTVTGIDNSTDSKLNITVFRNANGYITITHNDATSEGTATVCNALGQKLVDCSTTGTTTVIARSFLPGVYLVTVNVFGRTTTKKIILN